MSSSNLLASMKALDLGPSQDDKNSKVVHVKNDKPISKPRAGNRSKNAEGKSLRSPANLPSTELWETSLPSAAQNAESGALATSQTLKNKPHPKRRKKRKDPKSNAEINILSSKLQDPKMQEASEKISQSHFAYVVQAAATNSAEKIIGLFTSLSKANQAASDYASQNGISQSDIVDIVSSFAFAGSKPKRALATRRVWLNGTSEIRIFDHRSKLNWIRVLAQGLDPSGLEDLGTAYLALDNSFVIGAFKTKDEAWQACRKYSTQLSYCSEIEKKEQWFDDRGMLHTKGVISGTTHHWFVKVCNVDKKIK